MESKNIIPEDLYSLTDLARELGVCEKSVKNKISVKGFKKVMTLNRRSMYTKSHLEALKSKKIVGPKKIKSYYIYESKMNTL
jgi:hypothetical protein